MFDAAGARIEERPSDRRLVLVDPPSVVGAAR
jgi:hypothetical protein